METIIGVLLLVVLGYAIYANGKAVFKKLKERKERKKQNQDTKGVENQDENK